MSNLRRGYPLGALFLLVAACAVLTAIVAPIGRSVASGDITLLELIVALIAGVIFVAFKGAIVGAFHFRVGRGIGIGTLTGAVLGLVAGPLVLLPVSAAIQIFSASVGGSILLVIVGVVLRLSSGKEA